MSKTVPLKWPSLTLAHPRAAAGWTNAARRVGIIHVTDVPDDVDLAQLVVRVNQTVITPVFDHPRDFVLDYNALGPGKIISKRTRSDLGDSIQEACIARARELGLTAYAIAKATGGAVTEEHVRNFLDRRSGMGSHRLQFVLRALNLGVTPLDDRPTVT